MRHPSQQGRVDPESGYVLLGLASQCHLGERVAAAPPHRLDRLEPRPRVVSAAVEGIPERIEIHRTRALRRPRRRRAAGLRPARIRLGQHTGRVAGPGQAGTRTGVDGDRAPGARVRVVSPIRPPGAGSPTSTPIA